MTTMLNKQRISAAWTRQLMYGFFISVVVSMSCSPLAAQSGENLQLAASTFFGDANNNAYCTQTVVDNDGYIYGTGFCSDIRTTSSAFQKSFAGVTDVMVYKMDPTLHTLVWATYVGGVGYDCGGGIAVNEAGEVFITGYTSSPDFPLTCLSDSVYRRQTRNSNFILKLSADGSHLIFSRLLGLCSSINDQFSAYFHRVHVCLNTLGEAFVLSQADSPLYNISESAFQPTIGGQSDLVLSKISSNGVVLSSTFFGGNGIERTFDVCYGNGIVYCSGTTTSSNMPLNNLRQVDKLGDCFVLAVRDAAQLQPLNCFVYGSDSTDVAYALHFDALSQSIYLSGIFGAEREDAHALRPGQKLSGGYIARMDLELKHMTMLTSLGPATTPTSITVSDNNTVFIAGFANQNNVLPVTSHAYSQSMKSGFEIFLLGVDSSGRELRYGTFIGGSRNDYGQVRVHCLHTGCDQQVYLSLTTHSPDYPTTDNSYQSMKLNSVADQPAMTIFRTVPTRVELSLELPSSIQTGFTFPLRIRASSEVNLVSTIDLELVCHAQVFEATDSSHQDIVGNDRVVNVHIPLSKLTSDESRLTELSGRVLNSSEQMASIEFRNVRLDASLCTTVETHPAVIHSTSCYQQGRAIEHVQMLQCTILEQPVSERARLKIVGPESSDVSAVVYDLDGNKVVQTLCRSSLAGTEHELDLRQLAPGVYTLVLGNLNGTCTQVFIKQ